MKDFLGAKFSVRLPNVLWRPGKQLWGNSFLKKFAGLNLETLLRIEFLCLTLSRWMPISYRDHSIHLQSKSMYWFLYDIGLQRERISRVFLELSEDLKVVE